LGYRGLCLPVNASRRFGEDRRSDRELASAAKRRSILIVIQVVESVYHHMY
jgi:hypothetical protein